METFKVIITTACLIAYFCINTLIADAAYEGSKNDDPKWLLVLKVFGLFFLGLPFLIAYVIADYLIEKMALPSFWRLATKQYYDTEKYNLEFAEKLDSWSNNNYWNWFNRKAAVLISAQIKKAHGKHKNT